MTIFDKLNEERTGIVKTSKFQSISALLEQSTTKISASGNPWFGIMEQYQLSITLGVRFCANDVQLDRAREQAKKVLLNRLYGHVLCLVDEAQHAIFNGDADAVIVILNTIRTEIIGN
jgi:hypothetical protein